MCRTHILFVVLWTTLAAPAFASDRPLAASGKTQIVAKLDSREITISDLRSEMARLGLSPNDPAAEPAALESIVARALLADAAREARFHRQPEALRQMATAKEQALADIFLASASQPPEPTRAEIDDFILQQREIFAARRIYTFSVLTLPTEAFDNNDLTALFDATGDFAALSEALDRKRIDYEIVPAVQPSDAFPEPVRKQLGAYGVRDNIVIRGGAKTQIMKIAAVKDAPVSNADARVVARRIIMAESAQARAGALLESLKQGASVSYYRETAAPKPAASVK